MQTIEKILIIRLSSLGDIILASPLIRSLRAAFPSARIDFLLKSEFADLVRFNPHVSSVIEMHNGSQSELQSLLQQAREEHYDLIVDIHNSLRSKYLRWLGNARHNVVLKKHVIARWFLVKFKWNFYEKVIPVSARYIESCRRLDVQDDGLGLEMFVPEQTIESVANVMSKYRTERSGNIIGFAPSAKHFTKRWLPERYVALGTMLAREYQARILVFGGKDDVTYCEDITHMINMQTGFSAAENLAGKQSLVETAVTLDYCAFVVSNDTGLMHLAQARQKPVVAIFGSTVKEFGFYPTSKNSIVVEAEDVPCRPCSHIGQASCPKEHFNCMNHISVDDVLHAVRTFMKVQ